MNITIRDDIIKSHNLTVDEFMVLLLNAMRIDYTKNLQSLLDKGLGTKSELDDYKVIVSKNTRHLVNKILLDSATTKDSSNIDYEDIADSLRELYPKGTKPGTNYQWRGSKIEIVNKLKTLVTKYKFTYTKEEAIEATKKYIESFNGNYTYMQLLKYFLLKTARDIDDNIEVKSNFMAIIENPEESNNQEWLNELR